jgi:hypothetical protein
MKKIVLTFGLIAGALMSAMMLATMPFHDAIGFDRGLIVGYTTMVLSFLLVFFGVRSYRDNVAGGTVGFWRAFLVGLGIAVVASLCYVATWEVAFFKFNVGADIMDKYAVHEIEKARAKGESEASLAKMKAEMDDFARMYKNPAINAAFAFMEPMPVGLIVALVSGGVLSRRRTRA